LDNSRIEVVKPWLKWTTILLASANSGKGCANSGKGNANSGTCSHTNYKGTIDDKSIGNVTKGTKVGGTIDEISIGEIVEGKEGGS
jgi:hypothetical protein